MSFRCNSTIRKKVAVNDGGPGSFEEYVRLQKEQSTVRDDGGASASATGCNRLEKGWREVRSKGTQRWRVTYSPGVASGPVAILPRVFFPRFMSVRAAV